MGSRVFVTPETAARKVREAAKRKLLPRPDHRLPAVAAIDMLLAVWALKKATGAVPGYYQRSNDCVRMSYVCGLAEEQATDLVIGELISAFPLDVPFVPADARKDGFQREFIEQIRAQLTEPLPPRREPTTK